MIDRIEAASVCELEVLLESLFETAATTPVRTAPGKFFGRDPILGHLFITGEDHTPLWLMICKALVATARFRQEAPGWPSLPLRREDIDEMINADCIRCNVTGLFGDSLRDEGWSPEHPGFGVFVGGLLADRHTPIEIRRDPELLQQFSPRKLQGMCNGWLSWRSPEALALNRKMQRMWAAQDAAEAALAAEGLVGP
jgi:hypothetical protein